MRFIDIRGTTHSSISSFGNKASRKHAVLKSAHKLDFGGIRARNPNVLSEWSQIVLAANTTTEIMHLKSKTLNI
jgi:hypothetical protein